MSSTDQELRLKLEALRRRDEVQRTAIASYGVDLGQKRKVDLSFWAPDETKARLLSEALKRNEAGTPVVMGPLDPNDANQRWLVGMTLDVSVDFITGKENVATFLLFADKYDCEYDGWGTAIVEAAARTSDKSKNPA